MLRWLLALSCLASPLVAQTPARALPPRSVPDSSVTFHPFNGVIPTPTLVRALGDVTDPTGQIKCRVSVVFDIRNNDRIYVTACSNGVIKVVSE